jgi:hypothetical protein
MIIKITKRHTLCEDVRDISRESWRLPAGERRLLLGIVRQFRD